MWSIIYQLNAIRTRLCKSILWRVNKRWWSHTNDVHTFVFIDLNAFLFRYRVVSIKYSYYPGRLELIELLDAVFISSRRHRRSRAAKISQFPDKVHTDIYIHVR